MLVLLANGKVTLQQSDGEILEIDLQQVSAAMDRKYAAEQQQKAASNPFQEKKRQARSRKKGK